MGVPGAAERVDILRKQLSSVPCGATAEELTRLADDAHGYVGADLAAVCKEAGKSCTNTVHRISYRRDAKNILG